MKQFFKKMIKNLETHYTLKAQEQIKNRGWL